MACGRSMQNFQVQQASHAMQQSNYCSRLCSQAFSRRLARTHSGSNAYQPDSMLHDPQTDALYDQGSAGGALVDSSGRLVGMCLPPRTATVRSPSAPLRTLLHR